MFCKRKKKKNTKQKAFFFVRKETADIHQNPDPNSREADKRFPVALYVLLGNFNYI